ncbi:hypothetical protein C2I17_21110 [Niallia circulans]|uniref:hypothetical protein n=1 Tax=Niallia circulans TaxID=1397 RepID=UPI00201E1FA8|nr:hypothetical protein [Niallia circulans]UQZ76841.1 hypothetical protein C2I17_21110 [Niallia circulans]
MEKKPLLDGTADWSKLAFIREHIAGRNYEDCIELTPDQVKTVLSLAEEYEREKIPKLPTNIKGLTIEIPKYGKQPLLQITLGEEKGVPKVIYKGEEIELNREIFFHWESDKAIAGGLTYSIEHVEPGLIVNRIERRVKGHACD